MDTVNNLKEIKVAFITDNSPLMDLTCNDLVASGVDILFRSENIGDGLSRLAALKELPHVCIVDLNFYDKNVLAQLQKLKGQYPGVKLISYSDKDTEKAVKPLLEIGFGCYVLIGSDAKDFKEALEVVINGGRYFSLGVAKIAQEYFIDS